MALNYDLTRMKDREVHFPAEGENNDELNSKVQSMIWITMMIGISQITESNAVEFFTRAEIWQKSVGPMFSRVTSDDAAVPLEPIYVTFEDVRHAIGLSTNASHKSWPQFAKDLKDAVQRQPLWTLRQELHKEQEASDA